METVGKAKAVADKEVSVMRDFQFVVDDKGEKTAVIIDLKKCAALWEDFYDSLVAQRRANEPRESLDAVKKRLRRAGKLDG